MKIYIVQSMDTHDKGNITIVWHKHLFLFKEDAFKEALKKGHTSWVAELTQSDSWTHEEINDFSPYPGG